MRTSSKIKLAQLFALFIYCSLTLAQVGINTTTPSAASVLDISSSSNGIDHGGILIPRVSLANRNNIAVSPADDGLMIFLTEGSSRCFQIYDGVAGSWEDIYCMQVNSIPLAQSVNYNGSLYQGSVLRSGFDYSDPDGDAAGAHTYNWYRADDPTGSNPVLLQTGPTDTYTLTAAESGFYIAVEVIPEAATGSSPGLPERSFYRGPVVSTLNGGLIISEIADPANEASARFIEISNLSNAVLDISDWQLSIFANANVTAAATYTFQPYYFMQPGASFVLAQNAGSFATVYGFDPDASGALFNSNGNDNFEIRDQNGNLIDVYGQPGADQSGTCAEFTDGRTLRIATVNQGSVIWDESQWIVRSAAVVGGCTDHNPAIQNAPADFSPGAHPN